MEQEKDIGSINQVEQPNQVTDAINLHQDPKNNLQRYIPQNGGQIQAGNGKYNLTDEGNY